MSGTGLSVMPMQPKPKERYEKPELLVIELKAEEVLAVGCKNVGKSNVGTAAPSTTGSTPPTRWPSRCRTRTS